ncbi:MAG: type II secretion system minor pseudopilin GspI [bacterium]
MKHPPKPSRRFKQGGFTLIEVVIALLIIALALAAIIRTTTTSTLNTAHLREKTFAHWVALNTLAELRLAKAFPEVGVKTDDAEMAGEKWAVSITVSNTPEKTIRRVDVRVRHEKDPKDTSVDLVTAFVGKGG